MLKLRTLGRRERLFILVGGALILPAILVLALQFRSTFTERERDVREALLGRAEEMIVRADTRLRSDLQLMRFLGATNVFDAMNLAPARQRAETVRALSPGWKAVVLSDAADGEVLLDTGTARVSELPRLQFQTVATTTEPAVVDVRGDGLHCPCLVLQMRAPGDEGRLLSVYIDPAVYQEILDTPLRSMRRQAGAGNGAVEPSETDGVAQQVLAGSVRSILNQRGRFVARSLTPEKSLGQQATVYMRDAVTQGGDGFYTGNMNSAASREEMPAFAAYATSAFSGWSAHVAVDRREIEGPESASTAAMLMGALVALLIAGGLVLNAVNDLAVRKEEEERLMQSQKAEAIGQFTGVVVHDFRNLLAAMQSGLNQIDRHSQEPKTKELTQMTRGALDRGVRLTNQLLSFARNEAAVIAPIDLEEMLGGLEDLLKKSLGGQVRLEMAVEPDARRIYGNADQLELAFVNLAVNARDAMEGKGVFSISARRDGEMVELRFADTGPGVEESVRARLFEPLVTTKPVGKGTGLGLAQVAGAARSAGGDVRVEHGEAGTGAVFVMRVPLAEPLS